jgi:tRNA G26 N,N-dimethylase Trm1
VNDANADVVAVLTGNVERHSRPTTIDGKAEEMEEIEEANNEERLRFRTGESALKASHYVQTEGEISSRSEQKHERYCVTQDDAHAVLLRAALSKEYFDVVDCDSFGLSGRTISAALQVCATHSFSLFLLSVTLAYLL